MCIQDRIKSLYEFTLALLTVSQKEQLQLKCVICALLNLCGYRDSGITTEFLELYCRSNWLVPHCFHDVTSEEQSTPRAIFEKELCLTPAHFSIQSLEYSCPFV